MSYFKKKTITNVIRPLIIVDKIKHRGRRDTSLDRRIGHNHNMQSSIIDPPNDGCA